MTEQRKKEINAMMKIVIHGQLILEAMDVAFGAKPPKYKIKRSCRELTEEMERMLKDMYSILPPEGEEYYLNQIKIRQELLDAFDRGDVKVQ